MICREKYRPPANKARVATFWILRNHLMQRLTLPLFLRCYLAAAVLLMACGCSYTEYEIELTPNGERVSPHS